MKDEIEFWPYSSKTRETSAGIKVEEKEHFVKKAHNYTLEKMHLVDTEATSIPISDVTSEVFEWDITGARVIACGQASGGYLREVAENEEAFSYSLQDSISLYLLHKIATSEKPVDVEGLEERIKNGFGWLRIAILIRGGLLEMVGSEIRATERGVRELGMILDYSSLKRQEHDRI